jgi:hypothetical protein
MSKEYVYTYNAALLQYGSGFLGTTSLESSLLYGLLAYWTLNDASIGKAVDSLGYNDLSVYGYTQDIPTKISKGLQGSLAVTTNILKKDTSAIYSGNTDQFAVSVWCRGDTSCTGAQRHWVLARCGFEVSAGYAFELQANKNSNTFLGAYYLIDTSFKIVTGTTQIQQNTWYNVVLSADGIGQTVKLYVNGILDQEGLALEKNIQIPTKEFKIGNGYSGAVYSINGYIDEVGLWNRGLSASEVSTLYNLGQGLTYPFDGTYPNSLADVITSTVSNIGTTSASCGGNCTVTGGVSVTSKGICWGTSYNPTITTASASTNNGTGTGVYYSDITGLSAGTNYHVRAYAANSIGVEYGKDVALTTNSSLYGAELITNGTFDSSANWDIQTNTAFIYGGICDVSTTITFSQIIKQYIDISVNTTPNLHIEFDVCTYTRGKLRFVYGTKDTYSTANGIDYAAVGHYTHDDSVDNIAAPMSLSFFSWDQSVNMKIDNVSVKKIL